MATYFQNSWLNNVLYSTWLEKAPDRKNAICKLCKSDFSLSNMGIEALKCHMEGVKHIEKLKKPSCFFAKVYLKKTIMLHQFQINNRF